MIRICFTFSKRNYNRKLPLDSKTLEFIAQAMNGGFTRWCGKSSELDETEKRLVRLGIMKPRESEEE